MTPEVAAYLDRAMEGLDEARLIPAAPPLARVAARSADLAVFHAAEAFVIARADRVA